MKKFAALAVAASLFALAACHDRLNVPVPPSDNPPATNPPSPPMPCGEPDGAPC